MLLEKTSKLNIKAWQTFLNQQNNGPIAEDGIWGPGSAAATKKFQSANGLTADGLIGQGTLAKAKAKGFKLPAPQPAPVHTVPVNNADNIFDISHLNGVNSNGFQAAYDAGMRLVFHKATGGFTTVKFSDSLYGQRRPKAESAGLLWGAYHFANGYESGQDQAEGFLTFLKKNGGFDDTLMVLDYELDESSTKKYTSMNLDQARAFVTKIYSETGVYPGLYGAHNKLFSDLKTANVLADDILYKCWLWVASYDHPDRAPSLTDTHWNQYAFWQYAADNTKPKAPPTPGMAALVDRSYYNLRMGALVDFFKGHVVAKTSA